MNEINERGQYMAGYAAGKLNTLERLYVTIDWVLFQADHDERVSPEEFATIERTVLRIKNYMTMKEK